MGHFDSVAEAYDETLPAHVVAHYLDKRVRFVRALVPRGTVLDVGCGTGALLAALERVGYRVVGVDDSRGMLGMFARRGGRRLAQAGAAALPFRSHTFDLVITVATFHHLVAADVIRQTLAEMVRVATPGGAVLVWDHNPNNPYWPLLMRRLPQDHDGYRLVPLAEILDGLRQAGIRVVRARQGGWVPDFAPRWALPLLGTVERWLEAVPGIRHFGAHNIVVGVKAGAGPVDVER